MKKRFLLALLFVGALGSNFVEATGKKKQKSSEVQGSKNNERDQGKSDLPNQLVQDENKLGDGAGESSSSKGKEKEESLEPVSTPSTGDQRQNGEPSENLAPSDDDRKGSPSSSSEQEEEEDKKSESEGSSPDGGEGQGLSAQGTPLTAEKLAEELFKDRDAIVCKLRELDKENRDAREKALNEFLGKQKEDSEENKKKMTELLEQLDKGIKDSEEQRKEFNAFVCKVLGLTVVGGVAGYFGFDYLKKQYPANKMLKAITPVKGALISAGTIALLGSIYGYYSYAS